jgi:hypothetical protein
LLDSVLKGGKEIKGRVNHGNRNYRCLQLY